MIRQSRQSVKASGRVVRTLGGLAIGLGLVTGAGVGIARAADEAPPSANRNTKLEHEIQGRLKSDADLRNNRIEVQVTDDIVQLSGNVDSEGEKARAVRLAAESGVNIVENKLKVGSDGVKASLSDSAITTQVRTQMLTNTTLRQGNVTATTNNGVVTLSGTVPTEDARRLAVDVTRNTGGVKRVEDNIRVTTPAPPAQPLR